MTVEIERRLELLRLAGTLGRNGRLAERGGHKDGSCGFSPLLLGEARRILRERGLEYHEDDAGMFVVEVPPAGPRCAEEEAAK